MVLNTDTFDHAGLEFRADTILDEDGDSSLGEYTSRFAEYCVNRRTGTFYGKYIGRADHTCPDDQQYHEETCEACRQESSEDPHAGYEVLAEGLGEHHDRNSYEYCKLGDNYRAELDKATGEERAEYVRYCLQDYARLEDLNNGGWQYVGMEVHLLDSDGDSIDSESRWGIESDSGLNTVQQDLAGELVSRLPQIVSDLRAEASRLELSLTTP